MLRTKIITAINTSVTIFFIGLSFLIRYPDSVFLPSSVLSSFFPKEFINFSASKSQPAGNFPSHTKIWYNYTP